MDKVNQPCPPATPDAAAKWLPQSASRQGSRLRNSVSKVSKVFGACKTIPASQTALTEYDIVPCRSLFCTFTSLGYFGVPQNIGDPAVSHGSDSAADALGSGRAHRTLAKKR